MTMITAGAAVSAWTLSSDELFERLRTNYQVDPKEPEWAYLPTPSTGSIPWTSDVDGARVRALESGKPLVILFTGPRWSTPCRLMNEDIFSHGGYGETYNRYEWARVFVPVSPSRQSTTFARMQEYEVWSVPTLKVIDPSTGQSLKEFSGYMAGGPAAFSKWLSE